MQIVKMLFVVALVISVNGCSVKQSRLPGHYELQFDNINAQLDLSKDGTFTQVVRGERDFAMKGKWTFDGNDVWLRPGLLVTKYNQGLQSPSINLEATSTFGYIRLETDPDWNLSYSKK